MVIISLVCFLIQGLRINDAHKRRIILPFGIFYLVTFTGLVLLGILLNPANRILIPVISLLFNVAPFFGIKYLFLPYHHHTLTQNQGEAILDSLCNKYKISKREREIAELILLGNSNKEIEDKLFISLNTVKNHIYNLYQKLGVKSRGQLVHFILEFEKR